MVLQPQVKKFLEIFADEKEKIFSVFNEDTSVEEIRQSYIRFHQKTNRTPQNAAKTEELTISTDKSKIGIRIYTPSGEGPFPVIVYFHGGGWVLGNLQTADSLLHSLTDSANCIVVSVDYRLAPEHKYPAAIEDCYAAVKWVSEQIDQYNGNPEQIIVCGDGAGGNLAAVTPIIAKERGGPSISFQILIYPITDFSFATDSFKKYKSGYFLEASALNWFRSQYLNHHEERVNHYVSPMLAGDLSGLPPALIITAEYDIVRDDGEEYAKRLREAGVKSQLIRFDGQIHGFLSMSAFMDDAETAVKQIGIVLKRHFSA